MTEMKVDLQGGLQNHATWLQLCPNQQTKDIFKFVIQWRLEGKQVFPLDPHTLTPLLISTGLEQWTKSKEVTFNRDKYKVQHFDPKWTTGEAHQQLGLSCFS